MDALIQFQLRSFGENTLLSSEINKIFNTLMVTTQCK